MINRIVLMGRLCADPELKSTPSGVSVTTIRVAVDRDYVKAGAERQTDFFDVVAWRQTAEFVCRNFAKGSLVAVDGKLQSRSFETKDGQNRTVVEVVADNVSFTGERRNGAEMAGNASISHDTAQGGNYTADAQRPHRDPRVVPQRYQTAVQNPQYGVSYDPRDSQGTFDQKYPWDEV